MKNAYGVFVFFPIIVKKITGSILLLPKYSVENRVDSFVLFIIYIN